MAVPKKRQSNARSGKRRSHQGLKRVEKLTNSVTLCKNCGKPVLSHRRCPCTK